MPQTVPYGDDRDAPRRPPPTGVEAGDGAADAGEVDGTSTVQPLASVARALLLPVAAGLLAWMAWQVGGRAGPTQIVSSPGETVEPDF
jgi:hypothetical protein